MESAVDMNDLTYLMFGKPHPIPVFAARESTPKRTISREILDYLADEVDFVCVQEMAAELGISDQSARNAICPLVEAGVVVTERRRYQGARKMFARNSEQSERGRLTDYAVRDYGDKKMNNKQMMAALAALPDTELLQAGKIDDPLGANEFYSARTVVILLAKERKKCAKKCRDIASKLDSEPTYAAIAEQCAVAIEPGGGATTPATERDD